MITAAYYIAIVAAAVFPYFLIKAVRETDKKSKLFVFLSCIDFGLLIFALLTILVTVHYH